MKLKMLALIILSLYLGPSSLTFANSQLTSSLKLIPSNKIKHNSKVTISSGAGKEFSHPLEFEKAIQTQGVNLNLTKSELKLSYTNKTHGIIVKFAPVDQMLDKPMVLAFNHYLSGTVQVYRKVGNGVWNQIGITGSEIPYNERMIPAMDLVIPIKGAKNVPVYYFLTRKSHHRFDSAPIILESSAFEADERLREHLYFFYTGAFLSLILYNFFLFISIKQSIYLYYCCFALSIFFTGISLTGFSDIFGAFFNMSLSRHLMIFSSMSIITALWFSSRFFHLGRHYRVLERSFYILMGLTIINLIAYVGPWYDFLGGALLGNIIDILIPLGVILMTVAALLCSWRGVVMAKFFLFSWIFMFGGALVYYAHYMGIVPRNYFTSHGVLWGNLIEMIVVSLGLAYKISILDREKKEALLLASGKFQYKRIVRVLLHDIGTPLNLVNHYLKMKKNRPLEFEKVKDKGWSKISFGVEKMIEVITLHREQEMKRGYQYNEIETEVINLDEIINEVSCMFEESLQAKELEMILPKYTGLKVMAEKVTLLNDVINNLITNAIKYSHKGSTIRVNAYNSTDGVSFEVVDEGEGFDSVTLEHLLQDELTFSKSGTQGERGMGVGLFLVKSFMNSYGGRMQVKSPIFKDQKNQWGSKVTLFFKIP